MEYHRSAILGEDNIMWGNDYPHPDGVWPNSRDVIKLQSESLNDRQKQKVFHDNAAKLYGLDRKARPSTQ